LDGQGLGLDPLRIFLGRELIAPGLHPPPDRAGRNIQMANLRQDRPRLVVRHQTRQPDGIAHHTGTQALGNHL
jgi:hypothetical protein